MPSKIKILPDKVINRIAAGEVVERPSSVVKELVENSIDAGATEIGVDIEQAGKRLIRVMDNGCGMPKEDVRTAFERHATSKITNDADLESVRTMGFRGEALSSIAAVSHVRMLTAERGAASGTMIELEGGAVKSLSDAAAAAGTALEINHLFYNTPARLKFLKSPATEFSHILTALSRQAAAYPAIRFRLTHNKKQILDLPASHSLKERLFQVYGSDVAQNLIEFGSDRDGIRIQGMLSRPGYTRADKTYQDFYVNRRAIRNASLTHALYSAYADLLMRDRHPLGFLFIEIDPALVDVNVHPAKAEVRFRNQSQVHDLVRDIIRAGLRRDGGGDIAAVSAARAQGIKEALSDYLETAESRREKAEYPADMKERENPLYTRPMAEGTHAQSDADSSTGARQPARETPGELLFPLAQIHDSFIIAQSRRGMAIIDQHAAHERVLFEKLQDEAGSAIGPLQDLLVPVQVELGPAQSSLLAEYLPGLAELGLAVENFGGGAFMIKSVPALLVGADFKQLLLDILDELNVHGTSGKMDLLRDDVLSVMACHPAIKVHRKLDIREMEKLLHDLLQCRMPYTCPHGRPTIIRYSLEELKKLFKRM